MEHTFILPSSPSVRREDRFCLLDSDEYDVPFWDLLTAVLRSESSPIVDVSSLIEALETIALILRGTTSGVDYGLLREFMAQHFAEESDSIRFFTRTWPMLVDLALEMPSLFVHGTLPSFAPVFAEGISRVSFSRRQIVCLVVHQFLCSLPPHPWQTESFVDLHPWYTLTSTIHRGAVDAYLTALFTYFDRLHPSAENPRSILDLSVEEWPVVFELRTITDQHADRILCEKAPDAVLRSTRLEVLSLPESETSPQLSGLPNGACVISANKCIGHGPSGTQEELQVGTSPEAYPATLLAPPLSDHQVLVCRGAEAMVSIHGYGRDARLGQVPRQPHYGADDFWRWKSRTMLFMDALELDVLPVEGHSLIADIYPPSRLSRDMVLKAYNAFRYGKYSQVITGLWGCGTFGGNRYVKCILQWCAAALEGVPVLKVVLATRDQQLFGEELVQFAEEVERHRLTVAQMIELLIDPRASIHSFGPTGIFTSITSQLSCQ
ncbi:hypothetical protein P175DRAFT_0497302 [Aspergillus ochraceoroseus IBT 24754]|uniref:poly(ADP-ribose) glycohydrolase n=3 Tax=Aspergillus subgen. Nidulantes TaxID=2720870 RepID=A0A0F8X008_9EURO|nr:uncharacterized protein P175DRAFT_0497302 [Aspergillus ochraceoroseus IBT 24754]KKK16912.1 hypothetical protein ARAM_002681 [Aspergillus rambellii]KKK19676.1 hypothetical protein AOCH_000831 [Aspergillus ochraceoroseus]PTU24191.1 hypothetical protein P175DRAFT_0497302 [Aspergillus ochraceoroseus IBT 24754]